MAVPSAGWPPSAPSRCLTAAPPPPPPPPPPPRPALPQWWGWALQTSFLALTTAYYVARFKHSGIMIIGGCASVGGGGRAALRHACQGLGRLPTWQGSPIALPLPPTTFEPAPAVPCRAVLCCAVLCCAVLCCAVLCCAVLCCAVLCCAALCCAAKCCIDITICVTLPRRCCALQVLAMIFCNDQLQAMDYAAGSAFRHASRRLRRRCRRPARPAPRSHSRPPCGMRRQPALCGTHDPRCIRALPTAACCPCLPPPRACPSPQPRVRHLCGLAARRHRQFPDVCHLCTPGGCPRQRLPRRGRRQAHACPGGRH